jgi:hypothetical protein
MLNNNNRYSSFCILLLLSFGKVDEMRVDRRFIDDARRSMPSTKPIQWPLKG